jgi:hypothetical protein
LRAGPAHPPAILITSPVKAGLPKEGTAMLTSKPPMLNPISAAWNTVARFEDYQAAQRAVDRLSDDGFPVEKLDIIGSDLRLVERVTGRLTRARAAAAGAAS